MKAPAIIDTNVLAAGLITGDPESPTARVLDDMLAARFVFVLSEALVAEYHEVLLRPKLRKLHGLSAQDTKNVLVFSALFAIFSEDMMPGRI